MPGQRLPVKTNLPSLCFCIETVMTQQSTFCLTKDPLPIPEKKKSHVQEIKMASFVVEGQKMFT